jgi:hypothetical protein
MLCAVCQSGVIGVVLDLGLCAGSGIVNLGGCGHLNSRGSKTWDSKHNTAS